MSDDSLKVDFNYVVADALRRTLEVKAHTYAQVRVDWGDGSAIETVTLETASSTADTTSGSPNLTNVNPTTGWQNGMAVSGAGIPAGTTILSGAGTATMVMSANATASAVGVAISGTWAGAGSPGQAIQTHAYAKDGIFDVLVTNANGLRQGYTFLSGKAPFPTYDPADYRENEVQRWQREGRKAQAARRATRTLG